MVAGTSSWVVALAGVTVGGSLDSMTWMDTVAADEVTRPSETVKVKLSEPR